MGEILSYAEQAIGALAGADDASLARAKRVARSREPEAAEREEEEQREQDEAASDFTKLPVRTRLMLFALIPCLYITCFAVGAIYDSLVKKRAAAARDAGVSVVPEAAKDK